MTWQAYEVILRLRSPLHSGWRKVGNLQMTRPYITGRMLWGALTARLTRDRADGPATDSRQYQKIGALVHETLAFTYFYPALLQEDNSSYRVYWPWEESGHFRYRFVGSYVSTSLIPTGNSALEGSLHEIEYISPRTKDTGEQAYLKGYIFQHTDCPLNWRQALKKLQLGGERGYGWGLVTLEQEPVEVVGNSLFGGEALIDRSSEERPYITIPAEKFLLAHTKAEKNSPVQGEIEPLVGREWRSRDSTRPYIGQFVAFNEICYMPGSQIRTEATFQIKKYGVWEFVK